MAKSDTRSDYQLIELCNSGSTAEATDAFNALYLRHKDYVIRVARRYVADTDAALDVLQETFSWLLTQFPPPGEGVEHTARIETLLFKVARNKAIDILRRQAKTGSGAAVDPDELPMSEPANSELHRLLYGLSPNEREVVSLRFIDDLSLQEIADLLEIPLGTAKSRLYKAISSLRNSPYVKDFFET